jgi:hypothetical protein
MKFLPLVALLFTTQMVKAQQPDHLPFLKKLKKEWHAPLPKPGASALEHLRNHEWERTVDLESAFPRIIPRSFTSKATVITLSGDFMPCLVPSIEVFNMPNAGKDIKLPAEVGAIPNPIPQS